MKYKIGIVDYGIGNLSSISKAIIRLGFRAKLSSDHNELRECDLILLPGVGAFSPAMNAIRDKGLDNLIFEAVSNNKPIVGICLGMQILGKSSLENEFTRGLNLIPEDVLPLPKNNCHIGWNSINLKNKMTSIQSPNSEYFFNHSFAFPSNLKYSVGETNFQGESFTSIIKKDKIVGLQFHPERSQIVGMNLLKNLIIDLCQNA